MSLPVYIPWMQHTYRGANLDISILSKFLGLVTRNISTLSPFTRIFFLIEDPCLDLQRRSALLML